MPVVTNWADAVDGVLTDLLRFASYRSIGFTPEQVAPRMQITMRLAEHYEALITHLMAEAADQQEPQAQYVPAVVRVIRGGGS